MQEVSSEIAYQLPKESSGHFSTFFSDLDQNLQSLGIRSYSVGITALEEVFLQIGHGERSVEILKERKKSAFSAKSKSKEKLKERVPEEDADLAKELDEYSITQNQSTNLFFPQVIQLMRKKLLMHIRDKKALAIEIIFPVILVLCGLSLATVSKMSEAAPREMTPFIFP